MPRNPSRETWGAHWRSVVERLRTKLDSLEARLEPTEFYDAVAALDAHHLLNVAKLRKSKANEAALRERIVTALHNSAHRKRELKEQLAQRREEDTMRPVHVAIGKGATMVLWRSAAQDD